MELAIMTTRRRRRRQAGFTLIETLVAAAIFLIICIGVIPVFLRAMANNATGGELTQKVSQTGSRIEEFCALNVNAATLNWAGATTELLTRNYYTRGVDPNASIGLATDRGWVTEGALAMTPPSTRGPIQWQRTTRIRNYNVQEFDKAKLNTFGEVPPDFPPVPLAGGANLSEVSFKEVVVDLRNFENGGAALGRMDGMTGFSSTRFTTFKSF